MLKGFQSAVNLRKWDLERRPTLLAVSGGVDSVVMAQLFAMAGFPFVMAHMNFGLRGRESDEATQFVADLAKKLGVECIVEKGDVKGYRKRNGVSVQMAARDLRYNFFRRVMQEQGLTRMAKVVSKNGMQKLDRLATEILNELILQRPELKIYR